MTDSPTSPHPAELAEGPRGRPTDDDPDAPGVDVDDTDSESVNEPNEPA